MLTFKAFCENNQLCQKCSKIPSADGYRFCYHCIDELKQSMQDSNYLTKRPNDLNRTRGLYDEIDAPTKKIRSYNHNALQRILRNDGNYDEEKDEDEDSVKILSNQREKDLNREFRRLTREADRW